MHPACAALRHTAGRSRFPRSAMPVPAPLLRCARPVLALLLGLLLAACSSLGASALLGRDVRFTAPQLQAQLDRKFPRDYRKLGGLVTLSVLHPQLALPGGGRLQLDFDLALGGPGAAPRAASGHFRVESGLRYDPARRALFLEDPRIVAVDVPALGGLLDDGARALLNGWLLEYARDEPVYRLDDSLASRIAARRIERVDLDPGVIVLRMD